MAGVVCTAGRVDDELAALAMPAGATVASTCQLSTIASGSFTTVQKRSQWVRSVRN